MLGSVKSALEIVSVDIMKLGTLPDLRLLGALADQAGVGRRGCYTKHVVQRQLDEEAAAKLP